MAGNQIGPYWNVYQKGLFYGRTKVLMSLKDRLIVGSSVCWFAGLLVCWFVCLLVRWYVGL